MWEYLIIVVYIFEGGKVVKTLKFYSCSIPSKIDCVCAAVKGVIGYFAQAYELIDETTIFELKVILNELIVNAIKHGNGEDPAKSVKIVAGFSKDNQLFIIVEDQGEGYDYSYMAAGGSKTGEAGDICSLKETGRGIVIVNSLCDKVKLSKKGNKVLVLKSFK